MDLASLVICLSWTAASFIAGICGLGAAMLAVPIIAFVVPIHDDILVACLLGPVLCGLLFLMHGKYCRWLSLLRMAAGIVPGSLAGLYILTVVSGKILEIFIGALLIAFIAWQQFASMAKGQESWLKGGTAGALGGLLGTSISFSGPPVAAYGLYAGWPPREFLGTLSVLYLLQSLATVTMQYLAGLYTAEVLSCTLWAVPGALTGTLLSYPVARRIHTNVFRSILKGVIVLCGISCLVRALLA